MTANAHLMDGREGGRSEGKEMLRHHATLKSGSMFACMSLSKQPTHGRGDDRKSRFGRRAHNMHPNALRNERREGMREAGEKEKGCGRRTT